MSAQEIKDLVERFNAALASEDFDAASVMCHDDFVFYGQIDMRRIAAGEIDTIKVGNRHRIPHEELGRFWQSTIAKTAEITPTTSPTNLQRRRPFVVFLDADVLARAVTRTRLAGPPEFRSTYGRGWLPLPMPSVSSGRMGGR